MSAPAIVPVDARPDSRLRNGAGPGRGLLLEHPFVTVILAVRNEAHFIARALEAVTSQRYPSRQVEILVVDGESDDRTRPIVEHVIARDPRVRLLSNPQRRVAPGLNAGLRAARGEVIVRVDGHCIVPPDYVSSCVRMLRDGSADCAGGPVRAEGDTFVGRAIAIAMSTPFGVGGAAFRWARVAREVDHLPFGAWRREVFDTIGPFDETLVRNQDDELSDRLRRAGGRIVMDPAIPVRYFCRSSWIGLARQYWGYGFWKVRVIRKRGGRPSSWRHLVPATFVLATVASLLAAALTHRGVLAAAVLGPYVAFLAVATVQLLATRRDPAAWLSPVALAIMHAGYGLGFLAACCTAPATDPRR